jgi:hypothetical protein
MRLQAAVDYLTTIMAANLSFYGISVMLWHRVYLTCADAARGRRGKRQISVHIATCPDSRTVDISFAAPDIGQMKSRKAIVWLTT